MSSNSQIKLNFKVFLRKNVLDSKAGKTESKTEVRRFESLRRDCNSVFFIREKLFTLFPNYLDGKRFDIFWDDREGDRVSINTDDELQIALRELKGSSFVLHVDTDNGNNPGKAINVKLDGTGVFYLRYLRKIIKFIFRLLGY